MISSLLDEVVDDSEPERERCRLQVANEWWKNGRGTVKNTQSKPEVIEFTEEMNTEIFQDHNDGIVGQSSQEIKILDSRKKVTAKPSDNKIDNANPVADLTRFSFINATLPNISKTTSGTLQPSLKVKKNVRKSYNSKKRSHLFSAEFSDSDFFQLEKCISCDARWTSRKTAYQKMLHIQRCASSYGFTDDNIRIRLRKQLRLKMASDNNTMSGHATLTSNNTYFQDVVSHAVSKRKVPLFHDTETVKGLDFTRDSLLSRAQAIVQFSHADLLSTQINRVSKSPLLRGTQSFGESYLGRNFSGRSLLSELNDKFAVSSDKFSAVSTSQPT